ncbi:MAG: DUF5060 domain-containing protein [Proteobacteria bacterium]|nr:DUF5060 domain-containing protein [Pseudomonadota bacterium]
MRNLLLLQVTLLLACHARAASLEGARVLTPESGQYERAEIALAADPGAANPFDPNSLALDATVTLPSGKELRVPGFWFQDFQRSLKDPAAVAAARVEVLAPVGRPEWRVRFSSGETGVHRVVLALKDSTGIRTSAPLAVKITAGTRRGPVRVSPRNPMYLEDAGGRAFFPLGQNLCMSPDREGTYFYERMLPKLAANGANYVRLWQEYMVQGDLKKEPSPGNGSNAGFPLETVMTGIGRYDLESAWKLDTVSDLCDRHGVKWQLTFEMVVWWNRKMPHRWKRNRYNAENGGPVVEPVDYLTKPECRELAARRHRYSVARWGWSPNLVAWEMWNEVDNLDGFTTEANVAWHQDLCRRLRAVDPFKHLVTSSWRDAPMFALPELDFVQAHQYWPIEIDAAQYTVQDSDHLMRPFGKPFFFGEQGMNERFELDPEGKVFHDALWSSALSGAAGAGMHWHWNTYLEKYDLYKHYQPLAKFLRVANWPASNWKPMKITRPSLPVNLNVYGLAAPDRALVWVHDPLAFRVIKGQPERGPAQSEASLNVAGLEPGNYKIDFISTTTGEIVGTDSQPVKPMRHFGYGIELKLPKFWGDIAVRVIRQGAQWKEE